MTITSTTPINPLNCPLANYVSLCGEPVANLPPIHMESYLVVGTNFSTTDLTRAIFRLGFTAAQFSRKYKKFLGLSTVIASKLSTTLGPTITPSGPTHEADLVVAASKLTTFWAPRLVILPDSVMAELHPLQKKWVDDNVYVTFGFSDKRVPFNQALHDAIGTALVMEDRHILEAGSLDPGAHAPLTASVQAALDFQTIVGDVYKNRTASWHWTLSLLQIGISVCFRSLHLGQKPMSALKRFMASGDNHHAVYFGK